MPLPYIGGKAKIAKSLIIPNIPTDIEIYVECFSGMFHTFFKMNIDDYPNLKKIVYNDFNALNNNLFICLKNHELLLEYCDKIPVQKKGDEMTSQECIDFFYLSQKEIYGSNFEIEDEPNYDFASKYALVLTSVFSGANPEKSKYIDLKGKYHSKFTSFKNKLRDPKWQKLFELITDYENLDFQDVIEKYDSSETYIYADPPYYIVGEGNYYSNHDFTRKDHERLANTLKNMNGKFSLSYYFFPQLEEWFPKDEYRWEEKDFVKAASAKSGVKQNKGTELLIMNY